LGIYRDEFLMEDLCKDIIAEWHGDLAFMGRNEAGGTVQMGTLNGKPGIGPMEMLLLGIAGCTGIDVVSTLKKQRQPLKDLKIRVRGIRSDNHPRVYTEIEVIYLLWGDGLDPAAVERAIRLSEEKYCSASAMMRSTAKIRSAYHLFASDEQPAVVV
jgi:putative redox protein